MVLQFGFAIYKFIFLSFLMSLLDKAVEIRERASSRSNNENVDNCIV